MRPALERGDIFFFYRPRVGTDEVDDLRDVQRFFLIVKPDGGTHFRRIVVGPKRLPDPDAHERGWAFVVEVADSPDAMRDDLERKSYETGTRGIRVQPEARAAGEGRYAIALHEGHTHLSYVLAYPRDPGPAQRTFNIQRQGTYVVVVRNPDAPAPPGAGLDERRRAAYPPELRELFGTRRFIPVKTPELLDHEGAELVLIGAGDDLDGELDPVRDLERFDPQELYRELRLSPEELASEPLETGELR
jgi:hypothetical protein